MPSWPRLPGAPAWTASSRRCRTGGTRRSVVRELSEGRTVIVVAHRLSTVRQADEVVFLEPTQAGARVAQRGTPQELAAVPGPFREFIEASTASSRWHISSLAAAASSAEGD